MLKIRLQRTGKKHQPSYRVVLVDSRKAPQSGAFLEILGNYNPFKGEIKLEGERIRHWIAKGAQLSDTVHNFLVEAKIIEGKKKNVVHLEKIKAEKAEKEKEKKGEEEKEEEKKGEKKEEDQKGEEQNEEQKEEQKEEEDTDIDNQS